jgi:hypothetical protein
MKGKSGNVQHPEKVLPDLFESSRVECEFQASFTNQKLFILDCGFCG